MTYGLDNNAEDVGCWQAVAWLEATLFINNFILFYLAAVTEKAKAEEKAGKAGGKAKTEELTSVMMRPALVEGMESGVLFTVMLAFPSWVRELSWMMASLVALGIAQRTRWAVMALS